MRSTAVDRSRTLTRLANHRPADHRPANHLMGMAIATGLHVAIRGGARFFLVTSIPDY